MVEHLNDLRQHHPSSLAIETERRTIENERRISTMEEQIRTLENEAVRQTASIGKIGMTLETVNASLIVLTNDRATMGRLTTWLTTLTTAIASGTFGWWLHFNFPSK